ncbi:MAG TPA: winged helix-turn-helix domain-containing protein [Terriglobia bacterium]|nr:winged helix-turn-helix domain-containing protein [Terriglobia bacterium]
MVDINKEQLRGARVQLANELSAMEEQDRTLMKKITEHRKKLDAIDCLLEPYGSENGRERTATRPIDAQTKGSNIFTPVHVYWPAILASLFELGGSASADDVVEQVGRRLNSVLTDADKEILPSGAEVRWRNRVQWQRFNMTKRGLLRRDSPRGRWEITEEGRRWLEKLKTKSQINNNQHNE